MKTVLKSLAAFTLACAALYPAMATAAVDPAPVQIGVRDTSGYFRFQLPELSPLAAEIARLNIDPRADYVALKFSVVNANGQRELHLKTALRGYHTHSSDNPLTKVFALAMTPLPESIYRQHKKGGLMYETELGQSLMLENVKRLGQELESLKHAQAEQPPQ